MPGTKVIFTPEYFIMVRPGRIYSSPKLNVTYEVLDCEPVGMPNRGDYAYRINIGKYTYAYNVGWFDRGVCKKL